MTARSEKADPGCTACLRLDAALRCVGCDAGAGKKLLFGVPAQAWVGKAFPEWIAPDEADAAVEILRSALQERAGASLRVHLEVGGTRFWSELMVTSIEDTGLDAARLEIDIRDLGGRARGRSSQASELAMARDFSSLAMWLVTAPEGDFEHSTSPMLERVTLVRRNELESVVAGLTRRFFQAESGQIEDIIEESLETIAETMAAFRVSLVCFDSIEPREPDFFEYQRPDTLAKAPPISLSRLAGFPWGRKQLFAHELIEIPNVADLPPEAAVDRASRGNRFQRGVGSRSRAV